MPSQKIALNIESTSENYIIGTIVDSVFNMKINGNGVSYLIASNGEVTSNHGPGISAKDFIITEFAKHDVIINDVVGVNVVLEYGYIISDWSEYTKLT